MANLPDRERSSAVLIGVSSYGSDLPRLPAVRNNVEDLATLLTDTRLGTLRSDRCSIISDPSTPLDVLEVLQREASRSDGMLLVYYAGHGLIGQDGELYLGVSETRQDAVAHTALGYTHIREILQESIARVTVVILDCCFSGRAVGFMSEPGTSIADQAAISGTYVLASASPSSYSLARPGDPYTAFTGELIRILKEGIPGGPPLLTLSMIYSELRRTLAALEYPLPQQRSSNSASELHLVRNVAASHVQVSSPLPAKLDKETKADEAPHIQNDKDGELADDSADVEWTADEPTREDLLRRGFLADVIAMRLIETQAANPRSSFFTHVDGPWGSGKSTLLNLLDERVAPYFRIVRFDAWQQSRLSPPWWSLLSATRREVVHGSRWWTRPLLRARETGARMRRTGAPYLFAMALLVTVALVVGYLLWPRETTLKGWTEYAKAIVPFVAVLGTFSTGALVVSRFLLWDTARGARLFEQSQENPLGDIAAHFRWLLNRSDKPIAFFIDDLDRCPEEYVVAFLDTIQTLVRAGATSASERAAYFVLAADGAWLRRSYETAFTTFADCLNEPGRPLGYLFLDKFFQLAIPMPALAGQAQRIYLDHMLHIDEPGLPANADVGRFNGQTHGDGAAIRDRLRLFAEGRSRQAVESLTNPASLRRTEHSLRKFAPLLGHNPRSIKKFINTFSILRSVRILEGDFVDGDSLALWAILHVRWPELADYLHRRPDAVAGIIDPLWCSDHFPSSLQELAGSADLRAIVTDLRGGPLTSHLIRQCCGIVGD